MAIPETSTPASHQLLAVTPLEDIYGELLPLAMGMAYRYNIPFDDIEDLLHDTVLIYIEKQPRVEDPSLWFLGALRNRCLMYWRERQRRPFSSANEVVLEALAEPLQTPQDLVALSCDLERAIRALPEKSQNVVRAHFGLGYTPAETAELLGYKESGIYKIIDRCLDRLARNLDLPEAVRRSARG